MKDDTIKRSDAIKVVRHISMEFVDADTRQKLIEAIPSADSPQDWIPCSERLPKIGEKVLASTKKTVFTQVYKGIYSDPCRWVWEKNSIKKIVAWMPLPEPWKGADDE